jgi:predicted acylesterase/phospholipase RssA
MDYKNIVVLSGGGMRASYQIGVLKSLKENQNISPDVLIGTSGGAINGSLLSQYDVNYVASLWEEISEKGSSFIFESIYLNVDTAKLNFKALRKKILPKITLNLLWSRRKRKRFLENIKSNIRSLNGLCTLNPLKNRLYKELSLSDMTIPFYCNFVSLTSGKEITVGTEDFNYTEDFINAVIASASIPIYSEPIDIVYTKVGEFKSCVDGGIGSNANISKALEYVKNHTEDKFRIIVINCNRDAENKKVSGIIEIFERTIFDIMLRNLFNKDYKGAQKINRLLDTFKRSKASIDKHTDIYKIPIIHIQPSEDIGTTFENSKQFFNKRITIGYKDGKRNYGI